MRRSSPMHMAMACMTCVWGSKFASASLWPGVDLLVHGIRFRTVACLSLTVGSSSLYLPSH